MDWAEITTITICIFLLIGTGFATLSIGYYEGVHKGAHEARSVVRQSIAVEIAKFRRENVTRAKLPPEA